MRIYTKTGDKGETGLIGGARTPKDSQRIEVIGSLDELNAALGVLALYAENAEHKALFARIQSDLFLMGAELADAQQKSAQAAQVPQASRKITTDHVHFLETAIDEREAKLPPLANFILPGGTPFAARAHLVRAVCRRAERQTVKLHKNEKINLDIIMYLNRLSDLLFMLAREDMFDKKVAEVPWRKNQ